MTIDMRSYSGEINDQAAADQQIIDTNSYQTEAPIEAPAQQDEIASPTEAQNEQASVEIAPTKQELNFKALREEVDRMKVDRDKERAEFQQQIDMYRANVAQRQEPQKEQKMFEGLKDDDIPSVGDIERAFRQKEADYQSRIEELQVAQQYPDYAEVLEKFVAPLIK